MSTATLSRIESEIRIPRARDVRDLCALYGVDDPEVIAHLTSLVAVAKETGWWETYTEVYDQYATYIGLEAVATLIEEYQATLIPGLLQAPAYARAYLRQAVSPVRSTPLRDQDIEKRVEVRQRRQQLLTAGSLTYAVVIDEGALRRPVGGVDAMVEQLRHLVDVSARSNITIRVLPFDSGVHPGQEGGFEILTLGQDAVSDVVYLESLAGQIFLDTDEELRRYRRVFSTLTDLALDEENSREVFLRIMNDFDRNGQSEI